jgi:hypothetical protein
MYTVCSYLEVYFQELLKKFVGDGKSEICRAGLQRGVETLVSVSSKKIFNVCF